MVDIDSFFSVTSLISWLVGILFSLLVIKFEFLGKKDWFGNSCSVWVGIISISTVVVLLFCGLYWLIPSVLLIPVCVVAWRWCRFKKRQKIVFRSKDSLNYDIKRYEFYEWLSKKELFRWEVKIFFLPAMNILFEIGAIRKLDEELERLEDYKDWYEWKRLKSYVCWNRHEYQKVIDLLQSFENDKHLDEDEQARTVINLFGAYRNLEDKEGVAVYAKKLEKVLFERNYYTVEVFDDLMYYYDEKGDVEKTKRIETIIKDLGYRDYSQMLDIYDVLYFYNRRHGNVEANRELLDILVAKSHLMKNEERKRIFEIRLLTLFYENDYGWMDYSVNLYNNADTYLNYSSRVAFEFLGAVNQMVQNGMMQKIYPKIGIRNLYGKTLNRIERYVEEFDKELIALPDDFLYRKKNMLMQKMEYLKACANERLELSGYVTALSNTLHKIIMLCEKEGDDREKLHFLVVLADEMLLCRDDIMAFRSENNLTTAELAAISKVNEEETNLAVEEAVECVQEINQSLKKHHYERTLAYYIFYAAYLNMKLENRIIAKQMLARFHNTGVDIRNYTLPVQRLYDEVKMYLAQ